MPDDKNQNSAPSSPPAVSNQPESLESAATPEPTLADTPPSDPKKGLRSFSLLSNMYLLVFGVVVLVGAAVIFVSLKASKPQTSTSNSKVSSLTDQQIASLKGNTTLVGDSKQTLDVQSNSIFEGQILARADLNVAGTLKVGGPLSLPGLTVGGNTALQQVGVSGGLNVAGDTVLQGALTVQKNLTVTGSATFGSLNVSNLSVTALQLRGDVNFNQHLITSGTQPSRSNGTALGGGGTASVSGTDTAGTVSINTGSNPPAGCFITVNFAKKFGNVPHVVISASNSSAASLQYYANRSSGSFSVCTANVPSSGSNYVFDYVVID